MRKLLTTTAMAAVAAFAFTGCSSQDPFEAFVDQVNKGGGESKTGRKVSVNDKALRQEFEQAKVVTCKMPKEELLAMKSLTGMGDRAQANRAANQLGAMWEFACGKGHDPEMYKPVKATGPLEMPDLEMPSGAVPDFEEPETTSSEPAPEPAKEHNTEAYGGFGPPWPGIEFYYGDCDQSLVAWQLQMNNHGYDFQGTGCYKDKTEQAVQDVQEANGIAELGIGPETWDAAWSGVPPTK